jgi:hypothetical protein
MFRGDVLGARRLSFESPLRLKVLFEHDLSARAFALTWPFGPGSGRATGSARKDAKVKNGTLLATRADPAILPAHAATLPDRVRSSRFANAKKPEKNRDFFASECASGQLRTFPSAPLPASETARRKGIKVNGE